MTDESCSRAAIKEDPGHDRLTLFRPMSEPNKLPNRREGLRVPADNHPVPVALENRLIQRVEKTVMGFPGILVLRKQLKGKMNRSLLGVTVNSSRCLENPGESRKTRPASPELNRLPTRSYKQNGVRKDKKNTKIKKQHAKQGLHRVPLACFWSIFSFSLSFITPLVYFGPILASQARAEHRDYTGVEE